MAFVQTPWKYSDVKDETPVPSEGARTLRILDARYDEEKDNYSLRLEDLGDGVQFWTNYRLSRDLDGITVPNIAQRRSLIDLNRALFNEFEGFPNPDDIIGAVVIGNVSIKKFTGRDGTEKSYTNVATFSPVTRELAAESAIEQYYIGYEDDVAEEDDDGA